MRTILPIRRQRVRHELTRDASLLMMLARLLTGERQLPDKPTRSAPGSPERIAVYRRRARRGQQLHHPGDNRQRATLLEK